MDMRKLAKQMGVLAMAWLVSVSVSAYDFEVDGMYYNVVSLEDLTASLTYGETKYAAESVVIPETVVYKGRTLTVTSIDAAFSGCSSLVSVEIPNSVTSIGGAAFSGCSSLESMVIPDGVTSIGSGAFFGCSSLSSVKIPDGVTSISERAFYDCFSLVSVELPDGVTSIDRFAFYDCRSLASVEIPDGVTSIGENAFSGCRSLASVKIPSSVTSIGWSAFEGCRSLVSVKIPSSVTSIGDGAFSGCSSLESIELPIEQIGRNVLAGCCNLTSVTLLGGSYWPSLEILGSYYPPFKGIFGRYELEEKGLYSFEYVASENAAPVSELRIADNRRPLSFWYEDYVRRSYDYYMVYFETYFLPVKRLYIGRPLSFDYIEGSADSNNHYYNYSVLGGAYSQQRIGIEEIEFGELFESDEVPGLGYLCSLSGVEVVIYGKNITQINNPLTSASEIYLKTAMPPQSEEWSDANYVASIVYVPEGSLAAYQAADVWKNFWDIREWDGVTTGIASAPTASRQEPLATVEGKQITVHADADDTRIHVYNAGGCLVYSGTERVVNVDNSGLYIVRVGTHAQKLLVR